MHIYGYCLHSKAVNKRHLIIMASLFLGYTVNIGPVPCGIRLDHPSWDYLIIQLLALKKVLYLHSSYSAGWVKNCFLKSKKSCPRIRKTNSVYVGEYMSHSPFLFFFSFSLLAYSMKQLIYFFIGKRFNERIPHFQCQAKK